MSVIVGRFTDDNIDQILLRDNNGGLTFYPATIPIQHPIAKFAPTIRGNPAPLKAAAATLNGQPVFYTATDTRMSTLQLCNPADGTATIVTRTDHVHAVLTEGDRFIVVTPTEVQGREPGMPVPQRAATVVGEHALVAVARHGNALVICDDELRFYAVGAPGYDVVAGGATSSLDEDHGTEAVAVTLLAGTPTQPAGGVEAGVLVARVARGRLFCGDYTTRDGLVLGEMADFTRCVSLALDNLPDNGYLVRALFNNGLFVCVTLREKNDVHISHIQIPLDTSSATVAYTDHSAVICVTTPLTAPTPSRALLVRHAISEAGAVLDSCWVAVAPETRSYATVPGSNVVASEDYAGNVIFEDIDGIELNQVRLGYNVGNNVNSIASLDRKRFLFTQNTDTDAYLVEAIITRTGAGFTLVTAQHPAFAAKGSFNAIAVLCSDASKATVLVGGADADGTALVYGLELAGTAGAVVGVVRGVACPLDTTSYVIPRGIRHPGVVSGIYKAGLSTFWAVVSCDGGQRVVAGKVVTGSIVFVEGYKCENGIQFASSDENLIVLGDHPVVLHQQPYGMSMQVVTNEIEGPAKALFCLPGATSALYIDSDVVSLWNETLGEVALTAAGPARGAVALAESAVMEHGVIQSRLVTLGDSFAIIERNMDTLNLV